MPAGRPSSRRSAICQRFSSAEIGTIVVGMPPNETVSPSSTIAYSSTGRSLTLMPPLEFRSYTVQLPSFSRISAACCRETDGYSSCTSQAAARPMMFSQCVSGRRTPLPSVR